jgi:hypothetical protein
VTHRLVRGEATVARTFARCACGAEFEGVTINEAMEKLIAHADGVGQEGSE